MELSEAIQRLGVLTKAEYLATRAYAITKPVYILKSIDTSTLCKVSPFGAAPCSINDINVGDSVAFKCSLAGVDGKDVGEGNVNAAMVSDFEFNMQEKTFMLECANMIITTLPIKWPLKAVEYISKTNSDFNQRNLMEMTTASTTDYVQAIEKQQRAIEAQQSPQLSFE